MTFSKQQQTILMGPVVTIKHMRSLSKLIEELPSYQSRYSFIYTPCKQSFWGI